MELNENKTPKIIHIIYKNIDTIINIENQWKCLNPEYTIELYDDIKCLHH